jgi:protein ImuB
VLWTALYFPQLPIEILTVGLDREIALAISRSHRGRETISRCNAAAAAQGICPGLPVQAALALHAGLRVLPRSEADEASALQGLALWAYQFSPRIAFEPLTLLLETGASRRLFGGLEPLSRLLDRELDQLGHQYRRAVAPTPTAAGLLARTRPGATAQTPESLRRQINDIALAQLTRNPEVRALIDDIGLNSIGECLALPRAELARRTGPRLILLFDRLLGSVPDPRPPWQPPDRFEQRLELPGEITHHTALAFPAQRLIITLCGYLLGRGAATQHLTWRLEHREAAATEFRQGLLKPSRDAGHMLDIFRERIERVRLPEPVVAMGLEVTGWLHFEEQTADLLRNPSDAEDGTFLERLRNRLGDARVQGLSTVPDYRPERAWRWCGPGTGKGDDSSERRHPLWLLDPPCPLGVREQRPDYGGRLELEHLPERIETGWWDGCDVARDYFVARNPAGERLWVFRDRRSGGWYLHGLFD